MLILRRLEPRYAGTLHISADAAIRCARTASFEPRMKCAKSPLMVARKAGSLQCLRIRRPRGGVAPTEWASLYREF